MIFEPTIVVFLCFFLFVFVLSLLKRTSFNNSILSLFRVFFPSWRFFEDTCDRPVLYARVNGGEWQRVLNNPKRGLLSLFYNPEGNLFLAYGSLLDRLLKDASELASGQERLLVDSVSYRLVRNLIERTFKLSKGVSYQFKVSVAGESASCESEQDVLISREHAL